MRQCKNQLRGITVEEQADILSALIKASPDLQNRGYMGQGHVYRCPNGHPYVIGDCGGAVTEANCFECGVRIGGSQHRVRSDNISVQDSMDDLGRMLRDRVSI